jgi:hypothetical protein
MKLNLIFIVAVALLLISSGSLLADKTILQVGGNQYSHAQIKAVMTENGFDSPAPVVEKLQRDALLVGLGKKAESLYQEMFACESAEFVSLPPLDNELVCNRHYIFMKWLAEAARNVPVRFLDIDAYWQLVSGTEMYKVRAAHGSELSSRDIQFTQAELQVGQAEILARKDGTPYLTGKEFNDYVAENYEQIRLQFNRDTSLAEVRRSLVREMAEEKVAGSSFPIQAGTFSDTEIDQQIVALIEKEAFRNPIRLHNPAVQTAREMLAGIYARYRELHQSELTALRLALAGHASGEALPFPLLDAFRKARVELQKKAIAQALTIVDIQTWQYKSNSLSLSMPDALQQLTEVKYKALVAAALQKSNIQF